MVEELDKIERGDYLCMDVRENRDAQLALVDVSLLFQRGQISPVYQNRDFALYRVNKRWEWQDDHLRHAGLSG